ncbi:hypothetical protein CEXT_459571 [Caerostris extrusa]|uniref:Uncharacterized protein n=1 Tax=Caerostris extrusa TaxID=172846 RepID=A0AAV4QW05_CAEEX|nr:hypothetical protein CEXT_459571 [Caerostris extrusa]
MPFSPLILSPLFTGLLRDILNPLHQQNIPPRIKGTLMRNGVFRTLIAQNSRGDFQEFHPPTSSFFPGKGALRNCKTRPIDYRLGGCLLWPKGRC